MWILMHHYKRIFIDLPLAWLAIAVYDYDVESELLGSEVYRIMSSSGLSYWGIELLSIAIGEWIIGTTTLLLLVLILAKVSYAKG